MNTDKAQDTENAEGCKIPLQRHVMVDPFVSPEHKDIIDKASSQLKEYEEYLLGSLQKMYPAAVSIGCKESLVKIQQLFIGDAVRRDMIKAICFLKLCYERPRFLVEK